MEETNCNGSKRKGEALQDQEESGAKRQNVTMAMDVFDCPVCSQPLRPPIFPVFPGAFHLLVLPRQAPGAGEQVQRVLRSRLPALRRHGARRRQHPRPLQARMCQEHDHLLPEGGAREGVPERAVLPFSGCGFAGPKVLLLVHLTTHHRWPTTRFEYFVPFELRVQPGTHVLHAGDGRLSFLLDVASPESLGHAVSLVCVQPNAPGPTIGCSVCFSCFQGHNQVSSLDVGSSSLSDGLPTQRFCVVPKVSGGETDVVLRITIDMMYADDDEELEEEDNDDDSHNEDEDDDDEEEEEADDHNDG